MQFKNEDATDDVAPPSQHSASGSSSDSGPTNALSFHERIASAIIFEIMIFVYRFLHDHRQKLILKQLLLEVRL